MSFLRRIRKRVRKIILHKKLGDAIDEYRRQFRETCHGQLDDLLDEVDATGFSKMDVFIAYTHRGYGVSVGMQLIEDQPTTETPLESRARASGIEIVDA